MGSLSNRYTDDVKTAAITISEHLDVQLNSNQYLEDKFMWNNYFLWEDDFLITHWEHEKNFNTIKNYEQKSNPCQKNSRQMKS